ncbi:hypothetical protein [Arcticibacterium luteifluviistationis]|uniref:DUF4402 domain-containing protein n=1 Tax=Arcticibacterium luteifluviistationis TaxID=1784714 RepID=A0A2Z4G8H0_9BACT|nr:hypothetical protein [Arcticibacterium luteifluviistationis]AWV97395.1 hypothetical protein DJ013_04090 [Arcticibacterium luteifluviistationis]
MKKILILYLLILVQGKLSAQTNHEFTLPEIVLMGIEPDNSSITLELDSPGEAGSMNLSKVLTAAKRIIYTSALPEFDTRIITAEKGYGTIPVGTKFYIKASNCSLVLGIGNELGVGTGGEFLEIPKTGEAITIISGIGSSFTGTGEGSGHDIDYKLEVTEMADLRATVSENISIVFTILGN